LHEHEWRFEPNEESPFMALDTSLPILSEEMQAVDLFTEGDVDDFGCTFTPFRITEGSELRFKYGEDIPTYLMATVESITPLPQGRSVDQYPANKADEFEYVDEERRKRIAEMPVLTISMDEAYPHLRDRLLHERGVRLEMGTGSDPIPINLEDCCWARIWSGDPNSVCDRSLESPRPFQDTDEAFLCFDRAIQKQTSPGFPCSMMIKEYQSRATGDVYRVQCDYREDESLTATVLPSHVARTANHCEMEPVVNEPCPERDGRDILLRSWSRYCFNFSLSEDWKTRPDTPNFSFAKQFPKVAIWLTRAWTPCRWLYLERGVLYAVRGKNSPRAAPYVVHKTLPHTSLHAMFAEMEDMMPRSWKRKKGT